MSEPDHYHLPLTANDDRCGVVVHGRYCLRRVHEHSPGRPVPAPQKPSETPTMRAALMEWASKWEATLHPPHMNDLGLLMHNGVQRDVFLRGVLEIVEGFRPAERTYTGKQVLLIVTHALNERVTSVYGNPPVAQMLAAAFDVKDGE